MSLGGAAERAEGWNGKARQSEKGKEVEEHEARREMMACRDIAAERWEEPLKSDAIGREQCGGIERKTEGEKSKRGKEREIGECCERTA